MDSSKFYQNIISVRDGKSGHAIELVSIGRLRKLIYDGFDINEQDEDGNTYLHNFCYDNNFFPIKLLCEAGASLDIKNSKGVTPIQIVEKRKEYENPRRIFELLVSYGHGNKSNVIE